MDTRADLFPTRVVVIALAVVVVGGLGAIVFLASTQTPIPDALDRLVFASLGALSALLAKTSGLIADPVEEDPVDVRPSSPARKRQTPAD